MNVSLYGYCWIMDFFDLCSQNATLKDRFDIYVQTLKASERKALTAFIRSVEQDGAVSVNMRPMVLLDFLSTARLQNIHDWASATVKKSRKAKEEILKEKLKSFYSKRMAFDGSFNHGEDFLYGALNTGGMGAERYGEFCTLFDCGFLDGVGKLGYLKSDSLGDYVTSEGQVEQEKLQSDCCTNDSKHYLVGLKHGKDLRETSSERWPSLICNNEEYVEAIFTGKVEPKKLKEVRMKKSDYDIYWEYAYNEHRERLSELDRYRVDSFAMIDERLDEIGVRWEPVNDA